MTHDDTLTKILEIMLLPREFVAYLSRQIVRRLSPGTIETHTPEKVTELVYAVVFDELEAEDKLNDEVRDILEQYQRLHAARGRQLSRRCSAKPRTRWCSSAKSCGRRAATPAMR